MQHQTTLVYTEPLLRRAVRAYWNQSVGSGFVFAILFTAIALFALLWKGDRTWWVGAIGAVLCFGMTIAIMVYVVQLRNSMAKFRAMGEPTATLSVDDQSFTVTSGIGSSTLRWSSVVEVQQYPEFWLMYFSKAQFITLPLACLPLEMQAFILARIAANGART